MLIPERQLLDWYRNGIFPMGNPGGGIHEGDGLVVVLEAEALADQLVLASPAGKLLEQFVGLAVGEGGYAAFTGFAFAFGKIADGVSHGVAPDFAP